MDENIRNSNLKALIIYWSATGNTKKVACAIQSALVQKNINTVLNTISEASGGDLFDYDLVFLGSPSYQFLPPEPVQRYVKEKMKIHSERGDIKPCAPKLKGKFAAIFCTYSGPHTGINEATPAGDYLGQFFEHIGFDVKAKWYIVGEFHKREDLSTLGKLGDIRGRPNQQDLIEVERNVSLLVDSL
ncbi:MAG: nitric oxide synthase [Chloroflexi bacterium]|nr:nitric oxide synthase [Chloroflexota bacterium]